MDIEFVLSEFGDLFPELSTIGSYTPGSKLTLKKGSSKKTEVKNAELLIEHVLSKDTGPGILSLKVDVHSLSGFVYFHRVGNKNQWILLISDEPIFGLLNLFIQHLDLGSEVQNDTIEPGPQKEVIESKESEEELSAYRVQKKFLRKIDWLSSRVAMKAMYHRPVSKVSGCTYWYRNFESRSVLAVVDTNLTGMAGVFVTFHVHALLSEVLDSENSDIQKAVERIGKEAHAQNLKVSTEEDWEKLQKVDVGILNLDFGEGNMTYSTNGIPMLYGNHSGAHWEGLDVTESVTTTFSLSDASPVFLMNNEVLSTYSKDFLESASERLAGSDAFTSKGLIEFLDSKNITKKARHDMIMIGINDY